MKYQIEDTADGYIITQVGATHRTIKKLGGHHDLEELYAQAVKVWDDNRDQVERVDRPRGAGVPFSLEEGRDR